MQSTTFTFQASDRRPLHVYKWTPDEGVPARAVVHIAHGMAEHAGRYDRLADALTGAGYIVYAHDHRGHGRTAEHPDDLGFFASSGGWQRVVRDLDELLAHEKDAHPGLPLILIGHSMGASIAQTFLAERSDALDALVLSGAIGKPSPLAAAGKVVARVERARVGERGRSAVLHSLSFDGFNRPYKPARTPYEWLTRDQDEVDRYIKDPRCGFVCSTALWVDMLDAMDELVKPASLARIRKDIPIYVVAGSEDPVSGRTKALAQLVDAYRRAGLYRVTQRFYSGGRHEVFNETNRDQVTRDLIGWLNSNAAALPPERGAL